MRKGQNNGRDGGINQGSDHGTDRRSDGGREGGRREGERGQGRKGLADVWIKGEREVESMQNMTEAGRQAGKEKETEGGGGKQGGGGELVRQDGREGGSK